VIIKIAMVMTIVGIMVLCQVLTKPVVNQAFAQTACNLTLSANPGSGSLAVGESITQRLFGTLTCAGVGIAGATIVFTSGFSFSPSVKTDSSGNYNLYFLAQSGQTYEIQAYYAGDNNHQTASATTTIDLYSRRS
jgi:hypothetical protein